LVPGQSQRAFGDDEPATGKRSFYHDHELWFVGERAARASDIHRAPHLVFESDGMIRRVRTFPDNWRELSDVELWELSWHR
jgi:hypothetical protein